MHKVFDTPGPTSMYIEIGSGDISVRAEEVSETTVVVEGKNAEDAIVEQRGNQIVVIGGKGRGGFLGGGGDLDVDVLIPLDSKLVTKAGSADLQASGRLGDVRAGSGSGDIRIEQISGEALLESGSGDVQIEEVTGMLRAKTGSGDVEIGRTGGEAGISTGSGDVSIGAAERPVQVKSGSGNMRVREAAQDVALSTASGDAVVDRMQRGQLLVKNVSGDIRVGIPAGIPVWTDISCMSGSVISSLEGAGQPEDGQDYIEVRAKTISGDIELEQL